MPLCTGVQNSRSVILLLSGVQETVLNVWVPQKNCAPMYWCTEFKVGHLVSRNYESHRRIVPRNTGVQNSRSFILCPEIKVEYPVSLSFLSPATCLPKFRGGLKIVIS